MGLGKVEVAFRKTVLGEGPHWDAVKQVLVYNDIKGKSVHIYNPATGNDTMVELDGRVTLVVPVESDPNKYIVGVERELKVLEWDGKSSKPTSLKKLYSVENEYPGNRFNDGKCDSHGRLWAGTMGTETTPGVVDPWSGNLYQLGLDGKLTTQVDQIGIANGLAWSLDDSIFYYIDSCTYRIDAFNYDHTSGRIANRRPVFEFSKNGIAGIPDGMTIDTNGHLWLAVFNGHKILHIDPSAGKLINTIDMPTKNITSVAFGGPNLDVLYATSAASGLTDAETAAQPDAGCLFKITNTGAKGVAGGVSYKGTLPA